MCQVNFPKTFREPLCTPCLIPKTNIHSTAKVWNQDKGFCRDFKYRTVSIVSGWNSETSWRLIELGPALSSGQTRTRSPLSPLHLKLEADSAPQRLWVSAQEDGQRPKVRSLHTIGSFDKATRYWLDDPRTESQWRQDFLHPSRPALGPTQPPRQWLPRLRPRR